jgi:hypothetical protein
MSGRERNYAFEALAEVTGSDWQANRGELNVALKTIKAQCELEDDYLIADEIHTRARLYRELMPEVMLTPTALAKHWTRVETESQRKPAHASNLSVRPSKCSNCGGDRFVVLFTRKPVESDWMRRHKITPSEHLLEEYGPCPDCGPTVSARISPDSSREILSR